MMQKAGLRILLPVPDRGFDLTEVAVPWRLLARAGHTVVFATETGTRIPACDPLLLTGVIFGQLGAADEPKRFYHDLEQAPEFRHPISWHDVEPSSFDGLVLPGGHAQGMTQYLGNVVLQDKVAAFCKLGRPVGAICHGVLVLARARDPETGKAVLATRRTTCLPKYMERGGYYLTRWKLGRYYRTYPAYVEDEVKAALADPKCQFLRGPLTLVTRDTATDARPAFVVDDGLYVSARWPGDAYTFARTFLTKLEAQLPTQAS